MTLDEFTTKWNNKPVDFDGIYPNQCMDLMHQYVYDVLGLQDKSILAAPAAYQVFTNFKPEWAQHFTKIDNTPVGVPQKGDILFFGTAIGPYGHVCVFIEGDTNQFTSFDANWPLNSLCHFQNHNYNGVLGWFHPQAPQINVPLNQLVITDQTKIPLGDQLGEIEVQAIRSELLDSRNQLGDKDTQIHVLQQRLNECCAKLVEIQDNPVLPITQPVATIKEDTIPEPTVNSSLTTISSLFSKMLGWFGL